MGQSVQHAAKTLPKHWKPQHIPRWIHGCEQACSIVGCHEPVHSELQTEREVVVATINSLKLSAMPAIDPNKPTTPLCQYHHNIVYKTLNPPPRHCATCGTAIRRKGQIKVCPNPSLIQKHLEEYAGFEGRISEKDKVCYTCYRSHLVIIQQQKTTSTESDLEGLIRILSQTTPSSIHDLIDSTVRAVNHFSSFRPPARWCTSTCRCPQHF